MNRIGFNMKKHDKNSVIIESIPSEMLWGNEIKIINQMLEDFKLMINKELSKEEAIALSFSNRACIKNGDSLSNSEMVELVNRLFGANEPFICPNGNVILIQISLNEIENKFNRK